jgi:hypothetical protein
MSVVLVHAASALRRTLEVSVLTNAKVLSQALSERIEDAEAVFFKQEILTNGA